MNWNVKTDGNKISISIPSDFLFLSQDDYKKASAIEPEDKGDWLYFDMLKNLWVSAKSFFSLALAWLFSPG